MKSRLKINALIIFMLLFHCSSCQEDKWKLTIQQDDKPIDSILLILGLYSKITISLTNDSPNPIDAIDQLTVFSNEIQLLNENPIPIDTSLSKKIDVYIGRSCAKGIIEKFAIEFLPSTPEKFEAQTIDVTVQITSPTLQLTQKETKIDFGQSSNISIQPTPLPLMNIDSITVSFKSDQNNSKHSYATDYVIPSYTLSPSFNVPSETRNGEYGIEDLDYIVYNQKFTGELDGVSKNCFALTGSIEFSMKENSIASINIKIKQDLIKKTIIGDELPDYELSLILGGAIQIYPINITCAVHCALHKITDEDILNKNQYKYPIEELQYLRSLVISHSPLEMRYQRLSRLCLHRVKCILNVEKNENFTPMNFKSSLFTIGSFTQADIKRELLISSNRFIPINCITWEFTKAHKTDKFETDLQNHIKKNIQGHQEELDFGIECLQFSHSFTDSASETVTSICLEPNQKCKFNYPYYYYEQFKEYYNKMNTIEAVKEAFQLTDNELELKNTFLESDYQIYNYNDLSGEIIERNKTNIKLKVTTKGLPAECYLKNIDERKTFDLYEEEFYDLKNKVTFSQIESDPVEVVLEILPYLSNNEIYNVFINCLNLPNFYHYHYFFPHKLIVFLNTNDPIIAPEKETLEDCSKEIMKPYCKQFKGMIYPFEERNPVASLDEFVSFKALSLNEQLHYLNNTVLKDSFITMSLLSAEVSITNCNEYSSFTECRSIKKKAISAILKLISDKYRKTYSDDTVDESDLEGYRWNFTNVLFFLYQNVDSFQSSTNTDLIYHYTLDVFHVILTKFSQQKDKDSVILMFSYIVNNIFDLFHYMEIDEMLTAKADINTRLLVNDFSIKAKQSLEKVIPYLRNIESPIKHSNFIYIFHDITKLTGEWSTIQLGEEESSSIDLPLQELQQKKIAFLLTVVYSKYPLLSFNNTITNSKVIYITALDSEFQKINITDLSSPAKIHFSNIKQNDEMKYCGYINETNQISTKGIESKLNENNILVCETKVFSDFIVSKYNFTQGSKDDSEQAGGFDVMKNLWWIILLVVVFLVVLSSLGIYFCRTMKNEGPHGKLNEIDYREMPILK